MHSGFEGDVIAVAVEQMKARQQALATNPHHGFRGALHPALTIAVMPSSRHYHVVYCHRSLMSFLRDTEAQLATYTASPALSDADTHSIMDSVFQCFLAAEAYDQTVQLRRQLRETIVDILASKPAAHVDTVAVKPPDAHSNQGEMPFDVWQCVASFLPASDLLRLPMVGSMLFEYRSILVWWNLYHRCFGRFTPQQLRLVRRDITEDDDWPNWTTATTSAATEAPPAGADDAGELPDVVDAAGTEAPTFDCAFIPESEVDHRSLFFEAIWPHMLAHKRDAASGLRLSVDGFFEGIAPRGAITLGNRRLLLVNASPLHLLTIKRAWGEMRAVEVVTEDVNTCRGTIQFITVAVAVADGSVRDRSAPTHLLAVTPSMRREICAAASGRLRDPTALPTTNADKVVVQSDSG